MRSPEQNRRINELKREFTTDPRAYIESVGKVDAANLISMMDQSKPAPTTLRLFLGATALMPLRAVSYIDSALHTARHLPHLTQVQLIHVHHLGNRVNGIDLDDAAQQARLLGTHVESRLEQFPDLEGKVLHATDTPLDTDTYTDLVEEALEAQPALASKLLSKGPKHGGSSIRYAAAHYAFQDTDHLQLEAIGQGPDQQTSERILSVGSLQERLFYSVRMGMRAVQAAETEMLPTAQLFTKHVSPPYFMARGGEPALASTLDSSVLADVGDDAARRDLEHFFNNQLISAGETR